MAFSASARSPANPRRAPRAGRGVAWPFGPGFIWLSSFTGMGTELSGELERAVVGVGGDGAGDSRATTRYVRSPLAATSGFSGPAIRSVRSPSASARRRCAWSTDTRTGGPETIEPGKGTSSFAASRTTNPRSPLASSVTPWSSSALFASGVARAAPRRRLPRSRRSSAAGRRGWPRRHPGTGCRCRSAATRSTGQPSPPGASQSGRRGPGVPRDPSSRTPGSPGPARHPETGSGTRPGSAPGGRRWRRVGRPCPGPGDDAGRISPPRGQRCGPPRAGRPGTHPAVRTTGPAGGVPPGPGHWRRTTPPGTRHPRSNGPCPCPRQR